VTGTLLAFLRTEGSVQLSQRTLTFEERISYQQAIEEVYWRHRIWPKENLNPKPSLDAVMSQAQLKNKVADYLRDSQALGNDWQKPITAEQLQAEMDRMARDRKLPDVLRELFEALGNDPFVIAECLARPVLVERFSADLTAVTGVSPAPRNSFAAHAVASTGSRVDLTANLDNSRYTVPTISDAATGCIPDTWTRTRTAHAPPKRTLHTAV
jgi:hypothetical protein